MFNFAEIISPEEKMVMKSIGKRTGINFNRMDLIKAHNLAYATTSIPGVAGKHQFHGNYSFYNDFDKDKSKIKK